MSPHDLCLAQDRFSVQVEWTDFEGVSGSAVTLPFQSDDSGLFWFFAPDNWEILVKVLDGCNINQHFWVFSAASTDVEYTLRVTDHATGLVREYFNALGNEAPALADTNALPTCDVSGGRTSLMMFASPLSIPVSGTSVLTFFARDADGDPLGPGARIELEASSGQVTNEVFTDNSGEATATFTAGVIPGRATVTAVLEGSEPTTIELAILEVPDSEVLIFANPSVVPAGDTSQVSIIARDAQGIPLQNRRVSLVADLGDLDHSEVFTDEFGEAEVTFTAGARAGSGAVTAIASGSKPAGISITIIDAPAGLFLLAFPTVVQRLDEGEEIFLIAAVVNGLGDPFPDLKVNFQAGFGTLGSEVVQTDLFGEARNTLVVTASDLQEIPEFGTIEVSATIFYEGLVFQDNASILVLGAP